MSARVVRRPASGGRRPAARSAPASRRRKAKAPGLIESLPISQQNLQRLTLGAALLVVLVLAIAAAAAFRMPQKAGTAFAERAGAAGFTLRHLEVRGLRRMEQSAVNRTVYGQPSLAIAMIDLDAIRDQLLAFPWIKEARVSRRLPDTLVIDIEERVPAAIWQHQRRLVLVDGEGVALEPVRLEAMPNLPLVIGPGAQRRVGELNALLGAAPRLRPLLAGATWIGDRRWDLRFRTGETLSLPEGGDPAARALRRFGEMDERRQLLGGTFVRFDMRIEGRMIVRLREAPPSDDIPAAGSTPARGATAADLSRTI